MGAFLASQELIDWVGAKTVSELTTDAGTVPDTAMIDETIAVVEGRVQSAVAVRTPVVIDAISHPVSFALLKGVVRSIVRYELATRRTPVDDDWKLDRDKKEQWLKDFIAGNVALPDVTTANKLAKSSSIPTDMTVENHP